MVVGSALFLAACGESGGPSDPIDNSGTPQVVTVGADDVPTPTAGASPATSGAPKRLGTSQVANTTAKSPAFEALGGAKAHSGMLGRSAYQVEIPDKWNGELVLYAHGFAGFGTEVSVQTPPAALRRYMIDQGFAWAASSYAENGYVPGIGADDTLALKEKFVADFGEPKRTYIAGASMGGNVVALALENHANEYDGGLSICGAMMGVGQIDYLVSWVAAAEYTSGLKFPIGEPGANLAPVFLQQLPRELGGPENPTAKGEQFRSIMKNLTGGERPFFEEGFLDQYMVNFGLALLDPERKGLVQRAGTNANHTYDIDDGLGLSDAQVNEGVRDFAADPSARNAEAHPDMVLTTGKISDPLLTLHNTGDLFVPISMEQDYKKAVASAGKSDLLVQRAIRDGGHCQFSADELTTAFADLVAWVRDGKKPKGEDLSGDLMEAGREFTNPLRPGDPGGTK